MALSLPFCLIFTLFLPYVKINESQKNAFLRRNSITIFPDGNDLIQSRLILFFMT